MSDRPARDFGKGNADSSARAGRPFIGILFDCCGVYARVYRDPGAEEYVGRCPRCLATVRLKVGPGGTAQRIFRAV